MQSIDWLIDWLVHSVKFLSVCPLKILLIRGSRLLISSRGQNGLAYCNNWTLKTCVEFYILFLTHALLSKQSLSVLAVVAAPSRSSAFTECPVHIFFVLLTYIIAYTNGKGRSAKPTPTATHCQKERTSFPWALVYFALIMLTFAFASFPAHSTVEYFSLSQPFSGKRWVSHLMGFFGVHWTSECGIIAVIVEEVNLSSHWLIDWSIDLIDWSIWLVDWLIDCLWMFLWVMGSSCV